MVNGNGKEEEWGQENDVKIQTTVGKWWGRSLRGSAVSGGGGGDSGWGYGQGPNECKRDIGKRDTGFSNGLNDGRNGMLGDSAGEWMGEGLGSDLRSTKTLLAEERVLCQT